MSSTALPTRYARGSAVAVPTRARRASVARRGGPGPAAASRPASAGQAVAPAAGRTGRARAVRSTRRGRVLLLMLLVALLFGAFTMGRTASRAAEPAGRGAAETTGAVAGAVPRTSQTSQTTVAQGETLWGVARRIAPERDPREVVAQLRRLNGLRTAGLQAGQQLVLPAVR